MVKKSAASLILLVLTACRISTGVTAPLTIVNGLGGWSIHYVHIGEPQTKGWGNDRLGASETIRPGAARVFHIPPGTWDIRVTDSDGDTYTRRDVQVTEDGLTWEVTLADMDTGEQTGFPDITGDCFVILRNSLDRPVESLLVYPPGYQGQTPEMLQDGVLEPGGEFILWVAPGTYHMTVEDGIGRTFAVYNCSVTENGFFWEITERYMER